MTQRVLPLLVVLSLSLLALAFGTDKKISLSAEETLVPVGTPTTLSATLGDAGTDEVKFWTVPQGSDPIGIDNGPFATTQVSRGTPGPTTYKATSDGYDDSNEKEITWISATALKWLTPGNWWFDSSVSPVQVRNGSAQKFHAVSSLQSTPGATTQCVWPSANPVWGGTYGCTGTGDEKTHTHTGSGSTTDTNYLTVTATCGTSTVQAQLLVCDIVFGIHTWNRGSSTATGFFWVDYGHAWVTTADYSTASPTITTYGTWPDDHKGIIKAGLANGAGSDVRINFNGDASTGHHNRYYLLKPSQASTLAGCVAANVTWTETHNCSSFATDTCLSVTGEDVDADSEPFGLETPIEFAESIDELEAAEATSRDNPKIP